MPSRSKDGRVVFPLREGLANTWSCRIPMYLIENNLQALSAAQLLSWCLDATIQFTFFKNAVCFKPSGEFGGH
jgi:hypothetical protein